MDGPTWASDISGPQGWPAMVITTATTAMFMVCHYGVVVARVAMFV